VALAGTVTIVIGLLGAGCGGDNSSSSSSTAAAATTAAPEDIKVSDAEVTAGFKALPPLIDATIAAAGTSGATAAYEAVFTKWASFEGTVRDKDSATYLDFEDQLANLKKAATSGDKAAAETAKTKLTDLTNQYLAAHP
jgi:hypothetical protein